MTIDWMGTLEDWTCSVCAKEVTDELTRNALMQFLNEFAEQELLDLEVGYMHMPATFYAVSDCGFNNYDLCREAAKQLAEHNRLWETHLDQGNNVGYEFPMTVTKNKMLYYFKVIIYVKSLINADFSNINEMKISFHQSKYPLKVKL